MLARTPALGAAWRASAAPAIARRVGAACAAASGVVAHAIVDPTYPRALRDDPRAAGRAVHPRRPRRARRPPGRHRRHAQRHPGRPGHGVRARPRPRRGRRRRRVRAGQGHRRRRPPRRARRAGRAPGRGRRQRAGPSPYPQVHARLWAEVCERGAAAVGVAAGHAARAVPLPAAQPHPRRAQRGAGRRREPRARRVADHRPGRARALGRRHGRAGLGAQPGRGRHEPAAARRRGAGHRRRRRARGARARHPAGRVGRATTRVRCRGASRPTCWRRAATIRARSTTSSWRWACPSATAAMALARLERAGWVRDSGGWFEPVVSWSAQT